MAITNSPLTSSLLADSDLSSYQFRAVRVTAADFTCGLCNGQTQQMCGILLNKPTQAGSPAEVCWGGVCGAVLGDTVSASNILLMVDSVGRLVPRTGGFSAVARSLEAGAVSEKRSVFVFPVTIASLGSP